MWLRNRKILNRIRYFYRRAKNILIDSARRIGKSVIDFAVSVGAGTIILEDLTGLIRRAETLPKKYRERLIYTQYRRIQRWIEWQAMKRGLVVVYVSPYRTSTQCPRCGAKMIETRHRWLKCPRCGYENDRDVIAVMNIYLQWKRNATLHPMGGALAPSTAPQVTDDTPTDGGNQ